MTGYAVQDEYGSESHHGAPFGIALMLAQRAADSDGLPRYVVGDDIETETVESRATDFDVKCLRDEAREHADAAMEATCDRALLGDPAARLECARVLCGGEL